ncbi:glycoside hydrolase superfamily [Cristinia sonorae]|uniref:beta-galactosidase n=1 Tax=Cristinia sonorae TaxID=1940300 RepID=A0A8K0XK12_9AGAR|nr:glycoside hydrolase superfamily [Cristinia sonorae]
MALLKLRVWAFPALISLVIVLFTWPITARVALERDLNIAATEPPRHSTGLSNAVQWDNYTLFVNDQRVFIYSGEFHTFRLPVPDLWLDIFQKMVASGLNAVSIYIHWGLSNPAPGVIDFNDWRALQPIFDAAKLAGIFIVLRPGPYINAETTAGGLAHWATSVVAGELRTNATDYKNAWTPYIQGIINVTVPNQVSNGGPVIAQDNEFSQSPIQRAEYFAELEAAYRAGGIVVPLTYNDPGQGRNFINGTGAVDIYGLDAYPQGFDCSNPRVWRPVTTNYHQYHEQVNPSQPWYMPEFQGGAFDPWRGPGYDACEVLTGPDFQDVFYKQNWASNVKLISYYMLYGGTSWGGIPFPGVYTSYDYGAAIRESRALSPKFDELKRQALFLRSSPQFRKTDWVGDSTTGIPGVTVNGSAAFITLLRNPDSNTGFFIVRQTNSTSTETANFSITVPTSQGTFSLPQTFNSIALNGRQSKVLVTDYSFGSKSSLLYSTASIFFAGKIDKRDVLFLFGDSDQSHEFALPLTGNTGVRATRADVKFTTPQTIREFTTVTVLPGTTGLVTVFESDSQLVLFSDSVTTATFWAPTIPAESGALKNFFQFGSNSSVLVGGPYLVRNATITKSGELALRGDLNATAFLTVIAPSSVRSVSWNGDRVETMASAASDDEAGHSRTSSAIITGRVTTKVRASGIKVPTLSKWKFADSLPEIQPSFSDAHWILANHTTTNLSPKPSFGDGRVLFGCDYGFCENIVLWRGHFKATGAETAVNLTISGGGSFGASVFINDQFINSTLGGEETNGLYTFPKGSVHAGKDNVVTVIQDNMGNDEGDTAKSSRGILGFQLNNGNFSEWRVQGKLGGYTNFPDKTRGVLNEGGLFGERSGWHLPGFDTSSWASRSLDQGLPNGKAGVGFFVTTFDLNVEKETDVFMSFVFDDVDQPYRALLFVNGWQFGKRVANLGPQFKFPVHQGILNYSGKNTVAVALWALENTPVKPSLKLVVDQVLDGGVGSIKVNNPGWKRRVV